MDTPKLWSIIVASLAVGFGLGWLGATLTIVFIARYREK